MCGRLPRLDLDCASRFPPGATLALAVRSAGGAQHEWVHVTRRKKYALLFLSLLIVLSALCRNTYETSPDPRIGRIRHQLRV